MALTATKLPFLIQIKYDFFFSPQPLIKSTSKLMIKQFMKSSKFYQGERRFIFLFKIIVFPVIEQQTNGCFSFRFNTGKVLSYNFPVCLYISVLSLAKISYF